MKAKKKAPRRGKTRIGKWATAMIPAQTAEEAAAAAERERCLEQETCPPPTDPVWEAFFRQLQSATKALHATLKPVGRPSNRLAAMVWDASEKIQQGRVALPCGEGISEKGYAIVFQDADELRKRLGAAILDAFVRGDRAFANEVLKAFKQSDVLFQREQMGELIQRLMPHAPAIERACHTKATRRAAVEAEIGRKLYNEEWHRLQTAMHWTRIPKGKSHKRD
jgi:hypothetical protein